jgi:D-aspartate ligase
MEMSAPTAIVMNMFCTGLGIARSLGPRGVPVIGLSAHPSACGNYTRYAHVRHAPDSRSEPDRLLHFLLDLADGLDAPGVIFPTRDDDLLFLDRFRRELERWFHLVLPGPAALDVCLDKWKTAVEAERAGVKTPRCWAIHSRAELDRLLPGLAFPCVLKPQAAHHWRKPGVWQSAGSRKAIAAASPQQLQAEYDTISPREPRALVQEIVPGGDDCLWIAACYLNRETKFAGGFTAQKLLQVPAGFGTGCVVQTVDRPDLLARAAALLESIGFSGIAEVEFKKDPADGEDKLIEINPRPWDQHLLGPACGSDLVYLAYCDLAGLPRPAPAVRTAGHKWIAEEVYALLLLRALFQRSGHFGELLRAARGRRVYSVASLRDPLPLAALVALGIIPDLAWLARERLRKLFRPSGPGWREKEITYGLERANN